MMIDKTDIDTFIALNPKQKKVNIFAKYERDILYMREQDVALKVILKFLITKDSEIRNRYDNEKKFQTGVAFLSATIKRFERKTSTQKKKKTVANTTTKTTQKEVEKATPPVAPREPTNKKSVKEIFKQTISHETGNERYL